MTLEDRGVIGVEAEVGKALHQQPNGGSKLNPGEVVTDAIVRADGKGHVVAFRPVDIEFVGRVPPDISIAIGRGNDNDHPGVVGEPHSPQRCPGSRPSEKVPDRSE